MPAADLRKSEIKSKSGRAAATKSNLMKNIPKMADISA
jgi:hypothetical protein